MHQPVARPSPYGLVRPICAALIAAGLIWPHPGIAATDYTWTGLGYGSNQWGYAANWDSNSVPTPDSNLIFGPSTMQGTTSIVDRTYSIGSLTFASNARAMTLIGADIWASGDIRNASAKKQTVDVLVHVWNDQPATLDGGAGGLSIKTVDVYGAIAIRNDVSIGSFVRPETSNPFSLFVGPNSVLSTTFSGSNGTAFTLGVSGAGATLNNKGAFASTHALVTIQIENGATFNDIGTTGINTIGSITDIGNNSAPVRFTLTGEGSRWISRRDLNLESHAYGSGQFTVDNGAYMSTGNLSVRGDKANFTLNEATVDVFGNFKLDGASTANFKNSNINVTGNAIFSDQAKLTLEGGVLSAASFTNNTKFVWNGGTLGITGEAGTRLGENMLSKSLLLNRGMGLLVTNTLEIGTGMDLTVTGGSLITGNLSLRGGTVTLSDQAAAANAVEFGSGTLILTGAAGASVGKILRNTPVLNNGKTLQVAGVLTLDAGSSLSIDGGTLSARQLQLNGGSLAILNDSAVDSKLAFNSGSLRINGKSDVSLGAGIFDKQLTLSKDATLDISKTLAIGNGTSMTIDGGQLRVGALALNGGSLRLQHDTPPLNLRWNSGTLSIGGSEGAALGRGALIQNTLVLNSDSRLNVDHTLTVGRNTNLVLDGGQLKAAALALQGGRINGALNINSVGSLQGYGTVNGAVSGGADARIVASGGMLTLGDGNDAAGYRFAGTLDVGGNRVWVLNQGAARLGNATILGDKGQLHSSDGLILGAGATLASTGNTSIYGLFDNQGSVTSSGGTLSFYDDVSGAGSFAGKLLFRSGYNPGGASAVATVGFGGGAASYGSNAILTMEVLGSGHDQIRGISSLNFNGTLHLVFGQDFSGAPGSSIKLFDFQQFSGLLDGDHITVEGYDRKHLDFSHLSTDGSIGVSAVPEPSTYALLLGGLGIVALRRRRAA